MATIYNYSFGRKRRKVIWNVAKECPKIENHAYTKQYVDRNTPSTLNPMGNTPITPMTPPFDNHLGSRSADNSPYTS